MGKLSLNLDFFGPCISKYAEAAIIFLVLLVALRIVERFVIKKVKKAAKRTKTDIDDALIAIAESIKPHFYVVVSLWVALRTIEVSDIVGRIIDVIAILVIARQLIYSFHLTLEYVANKKSDDKNVKSAIGALSFIGKLVLWSFALLVLLSTLGVDITAIVAGLGIGGIAVALAAQNILSDLFSSLSIYLDKPFDIGDVIKFDSAIGTVQKIGIKTTRIQSLDGEEIIVPNQKLVSSVVQNFGRVSRRRAVVNLGVEYSTEKGLVKKIPQIVKEIVEKCEGVEFDRCHLRNFGDYAIEFELVYYVNSPDYAEYLDKTQEILFAVKEKFDSLGIEFAFPTQSIYLKK